MKILAIDSGVEKTGFSIFTKESKNFKYIDSGLIKTNKDESYEIRVYQIYKKLNDVIKIFKPKKIILERLFFFQNQKTAIQVGQTQGVIILLAAQNNISLEYLTPLQIKQTVTGYGLSDKKSVRKMIDLTLKPQKKIKEDDEIDAIACGLAYCYLFH
ncbi:crossover junction endodeoxyribonuclease RuvC [Candidatus Roizmanbacteria bacterium RIFCSPHIGHO2_02_FULL_37_15]|uniref:Crossover junction endodeoxyribonuclease RuvC n=1 Tax=Candidatus Roizmanbacteria bacterium RIFCSPLOWO2_01_FULL_37_16 TaxID=1802058 RepID=A0A1F7IKP3_9BACT|nr:MAG: crossover junction endodeoxyribonuclease RuvC [Candidatus Roizmanbacteria bacterium RIFCSPHIGHO2_01_FULL_37_16b]OGK22008.1 MAG: crossover junction endodeoxyribonuclease RuvC [Candidatus Roizmanbacteria bacterium RIFCSPHIGHO2_02_FULL_37_15]OGK31769.1 MAG: crossover junction endodeoxyribonuclease RuvC [Candidatus Roizmanbacteria bacterium RIFCSPHIGHO2_12_FULL_36_11]OGK43929.1 MAG: crossover junction endodeoxyribonuclease RuvC [Candidatus Roizmanbacteria bacterium RIFCSPLOWO2_01_FULL_37_16]